MNKRERILAAAVLALVGLFAGKSLYGRYQRALDARKSKVVEAETHLADVNTALAIGRSSVKKMEGWEKRSLPADREKALSLYKAWLLGKAKDAGLAVSDIKPAPRTMTSTAFNAIGYQIEADGSLSAVAAMLYEFYRSPQLHQITRLKLTRPPGATQLKVSLDVEGLCLPGAIASDSLPEGDSKRLKLASAADYQKSLSERDLATAYTPPRPPGSPSERREPTAPPKLDESELAYFSGTVGSGKDMQAWINVRTTGETLHLTAGDAVKVGSLEGQIESIEERALVLKTGDKRFRVALGESLRKGKELDANGEAKRVDSSQPPKS